MSPIRKSVLNEKLLVDTCMYEMRVAMYKYKCTCTFVYSYCSGTEEIISHSTVNLS